jgi:hypothetical protein
MKNKNNKKTLFLTEADRLTVASHLRIVFSFVIIKWNLEIEA